MYAEKQGIDRKNLYNAKDYDDLKTDSTYLRGEDISEDREDDYQDAIADNYRCKEFDKSIPEISGDEQRLIEDWYAHYKKIQKREAQNLSLVNDHIVCFLEKYPVLALNLGLDDVIFSLETSYLEAGNYEEFVSFLGWYRDKFRAAYDQIAPYLDHYLIAYQLVQGRREDIPALFTFYKTYPDENVDCLSGVVDLLIAADEEELLANLLDDIYLYVYYSPKLMRSCDFVELMLAHTYGRHVRKNYTDEDIDALVHDVKELSDKVPDMGIYTSKEYWQRFLAAMYEKLPFSEFPSDGDEIKNYYRNIYLKYQAFLHDSKKKCWMGADSLAKSVYEFLMMPIWEKKRPKTPFNFTSDLIEKHILDDYRSFFGIKAVKAITFLQGLYYFAEYLQQEDFYGSGDRQTLEELCRALYRRIYDSYAPSEYGVRIFQHFPR